MPTAINRVRPDPLSTQLPPEDIFCLLYTSGTTGRPKGVMIPHRQIAWNAYNTVVSWQLRQNDRVQIYTPMYHAGGLTVFMTPLFAIGGSIVLHDGFDAAEVLRAFRDYECTILLACRRFSKCSSIRRNSRRSIAAICAGVAAEALRCRYLCSVPIRNADSFSSRLRADRGRA
jgi:acyl-coenzyme A synthetase/AMP-(fatty) acid ligase